MLNAYLIAHVLAKATTSLVSNKSSLPNWHSCETPQSNFIKKLSAKLNNLKLNCHIEAKN